MAAAPLTAAAFARLMAPLGPFEARPRLAVAVSGGSDSMALALLAAAWARRRRGAVVALTVDHGLRPEAAAEARQVKAWLEGRGIRHRSLRWREAPRGARQAAARAARYRLLAGWCRRRGVLHLLLAHHLEDQAETLLLRLSRGSGLDGLAAMAAVGERAGVRLLRPLLRVAKARLAATLERARQPSIEDPSNRDPVHARVRMRALMPSLAAEGFGAERLAAAAGYLGRARAALDDATADLLARAAAVYPAGYVLLDPAMLAAAPEKLALRALSRVLMTVGGAEYPVRLERLLRLHRALGPGDGRGRTPVSRPRNSFSEFRGRTLGGCRIVPYRGALLVCREGAGTEELPLASGMEALWDGRFMVSLSGGRVGARLWVRRLGADGWTAARRHCPKLRHSPVPMPARASLPALWDGEGLVEAPLIGYRRPGSGRAARLAAAFAPAHALAACRFTVA